MMDILEKYALRVGQSVLIDGEIRGIVEALCRDSVAVQTLNEHDPSFPYVRTVDCARVLPLED